MTDYLNSKFDLNNTELIDVLDELPFWSAPFGIELLKHLKFKKNINVLDIGFGTGFPLCEIAMRLGKTCKIYGIDPWGTAIVRTRKKLKAYNISNVELMQGEAENIPIASNSIDLIVSNNGLNNVSNLEKVLGECSRLLKEGGQFLQTVNLNTSMMEFYSLFEKVLKTEEMLDIISLLNSHIYEKRKPLDEFISKIEHQGFIIESIHHHSFSYKFLDGTTMLNHYFIQLAFLDSWKNIIPANKQSEIFNKVETLMNKEAEQIGFFELTIPFVVINTKKSKKQAVHV